MTPDRVQIVNKTS